MDNQIIIKRQKIAIIILSIIAVLFFSAFIGNIVYEKINNKKAEISFTNSYIPQGSLYYCCELDILCKEDKIFNVNDFTFMRNGKNICVSKIEIGNLTYNSNQNFIINKYEKTKITLYITLINETQIKTIYYDFKPINQGETKTI